MFKRPSWRHDGQKSSSRDKASAGLVLIDRPPWNILCIHLMVPCYALASTHLLPSANCHPTLGRTMSRVDSIIDASHSSTKSPPSPCASPSLSPSFWLKTSVSFAESSSDSSTIQNVVNIPGPSSFRVSGSESRNLVLYVKN